MALVPATESPTPTTPGRSLGSRLSHPSRVPRHVVPSGRAHVGKIRAIRRIAIGSDRGAVLINLRGGPSSLKDIMMKNSNVAIMRIHYTKLVAMYICTVVFATSAHVFLCG